MEPTSVLVGNLTHAFGQVNQLLALGLISTIGAAALHVKHVAGSDSEKVSVAPFSVPMKRDVAQVLLIAIAFVAGLLASNATESARTIISRLLESPANAKLLDAACTYSSVATAPVGIPVLAALLPALIGGITIAREIARSTERAGLIAALLSFAAPYLLAAWWLASSSCRVPSA